jgi:hypothetical protein
MLVSTLAGGGDAVYGWAVEVGEHRGACVVGGRVDDQARVLGGPDCHDERAETGLRGGPDALEGRAYRLAVGLVLLRSADQLAA